MPESRIATGHALRIGVVRSLRPLIRRLPRGGATLYRLVTRGIPDTAWASGPGRYRLMRDDTLSATLIVDLSEPRGRSHWFLGRFTDVATSLLIESCLREGDTFIDVGAHHGLHSLRASRVVGTAGRVHAFEPDPTSFALLRLHMALNVRSNVTAQELALSDAAGAANLFPAGGGSTLRETSGVSPVRVAVRRGDDVLEPDALSGRVLIKIDTEGYEQRVLDGLGALLDRDETVLCVEVTDRWLRALGSSAEAVFNGLRAKGFEAWLPGVARARGFDWSLTLDRIDGPLPSLQYDAVFARSRAGLVRLRAHCMAGSSRKSS